MSWTQQVVASLSESKRCGLPFNAAWTNAVQRHPPRLHELGVQRRHQDSLLDQTGNEALEWYRAVCEAAYVDAPAPDGRPSRLRDAEAALRDGWDEPHGRPARHANRSVAA